MGSEEHSGQLSQSGAIPRRDLLRLGLAGGGAIAATPFIGRLASGAGDDPAGPRGGAGPTADKAPGDPPKVAHFARPLKIPPVLGPTSSAGGVDTYDLV